MLLHIRHTTRYDYEPDAARLAMRLKLYPAEMEGQRPRGWRVKIGDDLVAPLLTEASGDRLGIWHCHEPCASVEIVAEGEIETQDTAGVVRQLPDIVPPTVWLRETPLTAPAGTIAALNETVEPEEPLARMHALAAAVAEAVTYRPEATDSTTTAAEALALGAGVCQDHTHVFIAAARMMGVPARYVVGYLLTEAVEEAVVPAVKTHAWAEAHIAGFGWIGFDATHKLCPTEAYVRLCCGLDAADAAPVRPFVLGDTDVSLDAEVVITQAQQQSQS